MTNDADDLQRPTIDPSVHLPTSSSVNSTACDEQMYSVISPFSCLNLRVIEILFSHYSCQKPSKKVLLFVAEISAQTSKKCLCLCVTISELSFCCSSPSMILGTSAIVLETYKAMENDHLHSITIGKSKVTKNYRRKKEKTKHGSVNR